MTTTAERIDRLELAVIAIDTVLNEHFPLGGHFVNPLTGNARRDLVTLRAQIAANRQGGSDQ